MKKSLIFYAIGILFISSCSVLNSKNNKKPYHKPTEQEIKMANFDVLCFKNVNLNSTPICSIVNKYEFADEKNIYTVRDLSECNGIIKYKKEEYQKNKYKSKEYIESKNLVEIQKANRENFKKEDYRNFVNNFNYDWSCSGFGCQARYNGEVIHSNYHGEWTDIDHELVFGTLPGLYKKYRNVDNYLDSKNSKEFGIKETLDNFEENYPYNKKLEPNLNDKFDKETIFKCNNIIQYFDNTSLEEVNK